MCLLFYFILDPFFNTIQVNFSSPLQKVYILTKRGLVFVFCLNIFAQMFCIAKSFIK